MQKGKTNVVGLLLALLGTTAKAEYQVKGGLLLNIIIIQSSTILELLSSKNKTLLIRWNSANDVLRPEITIKSNLFTLLCPEFWL
jgi:hypothetical protein